MDEIKLPTQSVYDEEVLTTNYWKIVNDDISEILKTLNGLVLITHNSIEFSDVIDIINKIHVDEQQKIFYISLTRSYEFMQMILESNPLINKKMSFFDCASSFAFSSDDDKEDVNYHNPPKNLKEMKKLISLGIQIFNPDLVIIDSLAPFINFSKPNVHDVGEIYRFLHTIRTRMLNAFQNTFILFYDNKQKGSMQHLPKLTANEILNIEIIRGDPGWLG